MLNLLRVEVRVAINLQNMADNRQRSRCTVTPIFGHISLKRYANNSTSIQMISFYKGMRDQGRTQATLGECIGVDGRQVRRILDLDHNTSLSQLVRALKCLGKELIIDIRNAA